jgi:hypothetical protein
MKKIIVFLLMASLLLTSVFGCGTSEETEKGMTTETTTEASLSENAKAEQFGFAYRVVEGSLADGGRIGIEVTLINQREESYRWVGAYTHFRADVRLICSQNGEEYEIFPEAMAHTTDMNDHEILPGETRASYFYFHIPKNAAEYRLICSFGSSKMEFLLK